LVIISCAVEAVPEERFNPIVDMVRQVKVRELLKNSIVSDTVKSFSKINSYNDDKRIVLEEGGCCVEKVNKCCCGRARRLERELVVECETVRRATQRWVYVVFDDHAF